MAHEALAMPGESGSFVGDDRLARLGGWAVIYALAIIFVVFGASKFTPMAGEGIAPLVMNSPLVAWLHGAFGVEGTARVIGSYEILAGLLIAARPIDARLSAIGGAMAVITFLTTLSFLLTTPMVTAGDAPFPLSMMGQFLLKDLVLLAAGLWIFGESRAARGRL